MMMWYICVYLLHLLHTNMDETWEEIEGYKLTSFENYKARRQEVGGEQLRAEHMEQMQMEAKKIRDEERLENEDHVRRIADIQRLADHYTATDAAPPPPLMGDGETEMTPADKIYRRDLRDRFEGEVQQAIQRRRDFNELFDIKVKENETRRRGLLGTKNKVNKRQVGQMMGSHLRGMYTDLVNEDFYLYVDDLFESLPGLTTKLPKRAYKGDAGYDFCPSNAEAVEIQPHNGAKLPTGLRLSERFPEDHYVHLKHRSSAFELGITVDGIVDGGYRGEIFVGIWNASGDVLTIPAGWKLVQALVLPCVLDDGDDPPARRVTCDEKYLESGGEEEVIMPGGASL